MQVLIGIFEGLAGALGFIAMVFLVGWLVTRNDGYSSPTVTFEQAKAVAQAQNMARGLGLEDEMHGTAYGYETGCRCNECLLAFAEHPYNMLQMNGIDMAREDKPTLHQLERIDELIDHPAIVAYMKENPGTLEEKFDQLTKNRGAAGVLINWLKTKINKWDQEHLPV